MSKIKFARHPRSIVRKRQDHPSSLFVTVLTRIVKQWQLAPDQLVEFVVAKEDEESYVKIKKVQQRIKLPFYRLQALPYLS